MPPLLPGLLRRVGHRCGAAELLKRVKGLFHLFQRPSQVVRQALETAVAAIPVSWAWAYLPLDQTIEGEHHVRYLVAVQPLMLG